MVGGLNEDQPALRQMHAGDIPLGMKLKAMAGWNQTGEDWEMFLNAGGESFVASLGGRDVGTAVTIPYENHFSWVGMVLVDPAARRKGIGTMLLRKAIEKSRGHGPVRLDATPEGYELYKTLGFAEEYELVRMVRAAGTPGTASDHKCTMPVAEDIRSIIEYDAPIFGAKREGILRSLFNRKPGYARCIKKGTAIRGYCMGRSGSRYEQIGPVVAESPEGAEELLKSSLQRCAQKEVVVDAFADKKDWIRFLENEGFRKQRPFIRMCLGELKHPGLPEKQYNMAGPEIG